MNKYVYEYVVYWINSNLDIYLSKISRKFFALKSDAQEFARRHKNDNDYVKPWIIRGICLRECFKEDIPVEIVTNQKEIESYEACGNYELHKKIKY